MSRRARILLGLLLAFDLCVLAGGCAAMMREPHPIRRCVILELGEDGDIISAYALPCSSPGATPTPRLDPARV